MHPEGCGESGNSAQTRLITIHKRYCPRTGQNLTFHHSHLPLSIFHLSIFHYSWPARGYTVFWTAEPARKSGHSCKVPY